MLPFIILGVIAAASICCIEFWDEIKEALQDAWEWAKSKFKAAEAALRTILKVVNKRIQVFIRAYYSGATHNAVNVEESIKRQVQASEIPADVLEELQQKGIIDISNRPELANELY